MGAATSRMHFLPRNHVAGAHRILFTFAILAPALPHPNTSQGRVREAAMIVRKFKIRWWIPRMIVGPEPQIFVDMVWIHDLPWIHFPIGIPDSLELAKGLDQIAPKHLVKEVGFRLSV